MLGPGYVRGPSVFGPSAFMTRVVNADGRLIRRLCEKDMTEKEKNDFIEREQIKDVLKAILIAPGVVVVLYHLLQLLR